jgi:hypothetical protein
MVSSFEELFNIISPEFNSKKFLKMAKSKVILKIISYGKPLLIELIRIIQIIIKIRKLIEMVVLKDQEVIDILL